MKAEFLGHSGFWVELEQVVLLFDWWKGSLPIKEKGKPIYVFISHAHEDHCNPAVFSLYDGKNDVRFFLGEDIVLDETLCSRWELTPQMVQQCTIVHTNEIIRLENLTVTGLKSTDEGVAFLVETGDKVIYHAGDLNWWHWEGEPDWWNQEMEQKFKEYTAPLKGRHIDLAMLPLDPRLGGAYDRAMLYYLQLAEIGCCLPMHQWNRYEVTYDFLEKYPQYKGIVLPLHRENEAIEL